MVGPNRSNFHYKIMQNQTIVGIDVGSATLDICVSVGGVQKSALIKNETAAIRKFFDAYKKECLWVGMENTGRYNWALYGVLGELHHRVYVIPPLHLKKSMGLARGKDDRTDAVRIAAFVGKNHGESPEWKPSPPAVQKLRVLLTERASRIKTRKRLRAQQHDYPKMKHLGLDGPLLGLNREHLLLVGSQIAAIENDIEALVAAHVDMREQARLIRSVPGVGKVLSWMMLAKTENFTTITEPRKMACHSGVVPFPNRSGTSLRGRDRVSHYADKTMKSILHLAAMSAIRLDNDLRLYYLRKVAEGKNKMSVLNAVRNKIIHRIFAVIKNQTPYVNLLLLS